MGTSSMKWRAEHDHAGDPEEEDVEAGDQEGGGVEGGEVRRQVEVGVFVRRCRASRRR